MGYDITYHPASEADIQQVYFNQLAANSVADGRLNLLSADDRQRYLSIIEQGKQVKNTEHFDTTHGYFAAIALGFFQKYYYIRGASLSFLLDTYPYYRQYISRWHKILPDFAFSQTVDNTIISNYSSGVYLSATGVNNLWHDYHHHAQIQLELEFYFDTDISQFLAALDDARKQNKGLLEATEVYSPSEGNCSSDQHLVVENNSVPEVNPNISLEKQYYQLVNALLDKANNVKIASLGKLKMDYPFPEKIEFALGWIKDECMGALDAEQHYLNAIASGFDNFITHHFLGEFYRLVKKDNQQAITQYQLSLDKNPNYELNYIRIGDIAEQERDWKAAKSAYEKAIAIYPLAAEYYNNLGVYEQHLFNAKQSIAYYRKAMQLKHNYFDVYKNLAWQLYKNYEFEESQAVALLALTQFPNKGTFYDVLGRASLKSGDKQQAIDYFNESIADYPSYAPCYCELADIYEDVPEKYFAVINQCIDQNPSYGFAYYKRGKLFSRQGEYAHAEKDYLAAIELGDITANSYASLAFVYSNLKQPIKAIDALQQAIDLEPNYELAHRNMALAYWDLGESDKALQKLDDALSLVPDSYVALLNKGIYLKNLKRFDEAINACKNLLRSYPQDTKARSTLAKCYYETQQWFDAIVQYKKVLLVDANDEAALFYTAICYHQLHNYHVAGYCYNQLIKNKPQAIDYFNRGLCHEQLGNTSLAIDDYNHALRLNPDYDKAKNAIQRLNQRQRAAQKKSWNPFAKPKVQPATISFIMPEIAASIELAKLCGWPESQCEAALGYLQQAKICFNRPYDIISAYDDFADQNPQNYLLFIYLDWKETVEVFCHKLAAILEQSYGIDETIPLGDWHPEGQVMVDEAQDHFAKHLKSKNLNLTYIETEGDDYAFVVHPTESYNAVEEQINLLGWNCSCVIE